MLPSALTALASPDSRETSPGGDSSVALEEQHEMQMREGLNEVEVEVIDLFVSIVRMLGIPKSVAEIYGLLFVALEPMTLDGIVDRLHISKGSVSQGLKLLRTFGGVRTTYVAGDRRDHYLAETELKKLVGGFIRGQIQPRLEAGTQRLEWVGEIAERLQTNESRAEFYDARVRKLQQWHGRSLALLPLLNGMLDATSQREGGES